MLDNDVIQRGRKVEQGGRSRHSQRDKKEAHAAASFFELGKIFAEMGCVIEKVQFCLPGTRRKAKSAEATVGLLDTVEVLSAEAESEGDQRADCSRMGNEQDRLPGIILEEIIQKRGNSLV